MTAFNPENFSTDLQQARDLLKKGEHAAALARVDDMLDAFPGDVRLGFLKGVVQRRLGEHAAACQSLESVVHEVPELAEARSELGQAYFALKRLDEARHQLQAAVSLNAKLGAAWKTLGDIYAIGGEDEQAADAYQQQLKSLNQHPAVLQAIMLLEDGRTGMAEGILRDYLQRYPKDFRALRLLGEIGLKLGIYPEAGVLLERCLELAPDFHLARNNYANALGKSHKFAQALDELHYLQKVEPNNLSHPVLAAALLASMGNFEAALATYQDLLEAMPDHARLQMSYGHVLKTVGQQSQAVAAYRAAIAAEPTLGEVWWSLANLKTFRFSDEDLTTMQALLAQDDIAHADRFHLCFALAKNLEDRTDYDTAFAHYTRGNELKKIHSGYNADDTSERVRDAQAHCGTELFQRTKGMGHCSSEPFFIVGLPRSGSTLLEQVLASHSLVEGTAELPYIGQLARELGGKKRKSDASNYPHILWQLEPEQRRELGQRYLDLAQVQRGDTPFFIDKMPNNFMHVGLIQQILPNARIIDARRHPMATCFSAFKQLFAAGQEFSYDLHDIGRYYLDYVAMMDHWEAVLPGKVLLVQYEMVVDDFELQVRRLLDYCGLDFEAACLAFHSSPRAVRTASSEQVRQPIYSDALQQWRHFSPHLQVLERTLSPLQERYPY